MKRFLLLALAVVLAGCAASGGDDPFAYTRKPLYAGGFDLARVAGASDAQEFRVTDGSIAAIELRVWINATTGGARVLIADPSGYQAMYAQQTGLVTSGLQLGVWTVRVEADEGSAGIVHVLATRG